MLVLRMLWGTFEDLNIIFEKQFDSDEATSLRDADYFLQVTKRSTL